MARSNSVNIVCLHEQKVLFHELVGNTSTMDWMMFVTVGTLNNDALPVHLDETVLELHLAEADAVGDNLIVS